ncbi:MAG: hypothetical protein HY815_09765 [Candidatus Riflebacteria bacterium]|nr:hypothetical protein [Candidatus Riflebacteria bacterium]
MRINDELLRRAKKRAMDEGRTLTSLIEDGLRLTLARSRSGRREEVVLPVSKATGGVRPGVDLNRFGDLEEVMDAS